MNNQLTVGFIGDIVRSETLNGQFNVQVLESKKLEDRVKLTISDGKHFLSAVLASGNNNFFETGKLKPNSIIKIKDAHVRDLTEGKVVLIIDMETGYPFNQKIGNPVEFGKANGVTTDSVPIKRQSVGNQVIFYFMNIFSGCMQVITSQLLETK